MSRRWFRVLPVMLLLTGCYTLRPVGSASPEPGDRLALDLNDQGRLALGGTMGPEIAQIEGPLVENGNSEYLIAVRSVKLLRGGEQTWSGERVRVSRDFVNTVYVREFSKGRTIAASAVAVGVVAAFFLSRDLFGLGQNDTEDPGPKPDPDQLVWPWTRGLNP